MLERFSRKRTAEKEQNIWYKAQVAIQKHEDDKRAQFRNAIMLAQQYIAENEAAKQAEVVVKPEPVAVASLGFAAAEKTPAEKTPRRTKKVSAGRIKHGFRGLRRRLAKYELAGGIAALTLSPAAPLATVPISAETGVQQAGSDTTTPSATRQARVDTPSATGVGTAELDDAVRGIVSRERTNTTVASAVAAEPTVQTPIETTTQAQPEQNSSPSTESLDNASRGVDMATEQAQEAAKTLGIEEDDQISKNVGEQLTAARNAIASAEAASNQGDGSKDKDKDKDKNEEKHVHDENCPEDHKYHPSTTVPKTSTTVSTTSTTVYTPTTHTYPPKTTTTSTTKFVKPTTTTSTTVDTPDTTVVIPSTTSTTEAPTTTTSTSTTSTTPTTAFVPSTTSTTEAPVPQTSTSSTTPTTAFELTFVTNAPTTTTTVKAQEEKALPQRTMPRTGSDSAALAFPALGLVFAGDALNVLARKRDKKDLVNA